ncbi:hypothetical protein [Arsukibacterium indicum]|uniref:Uncharacterized protein n=1 Tax=Arsukibacterium indicum TaxID=2848612 RepID=A0ABS6ML80_9GAMM|nr:hypothetical protein [Arsukibacterium indicum]MBV2129017.1 hypothetical protein [Arsukibacterium indicum]
MSVELYDALVWIALASTISTLISMWCFIRVTVKYFDKELARMGRDWVTSDWRGSRIGTYALAIIWQRASIFYEIRHEDGSALARRRDYVLAVWMQISLMVCMIAAIIFYPEMSE